MVMHTFTDLGYSRETLGFGGPLLCLFIQTQPVLSDSGNSQLLRKVGIKRQSYKIYIKTTHNMWWSAFL